jgi:ACT domain-containing protein
MKNPTMSTLDVFKNEVMGVHLTMFSIHKMSSISCTISTSKNEKINNEKHENDYLEP